MTTSSLTESSHPYALSSDLAKLCLPAEYRDSLRRFAWVDSICFLFLLIGLIGFKTPKVEVKPLEPPQEIIPVVFTLPPETQKKEEPPPDEPPEPQETTVETPTVVTIVAPNPAAVAFAVPVEGPVMVAPSARFATPPPPKVVPPKPTKFDPNAQSTGKYPPPDYPGIAIRNRYQGKVTVEISVNEAGAVESALVKNSSGYTALDEAAVRVVKESWRFAPGPKRLLLWDCTFQLR